MASWSPISSRHGRRDDLQVANKKTVNLALQGGGAHGAFTWGVLDKLLEDGRLGFEGISGTSAGAMNAVALADGWYERGADGAREKLETFWRAISRNGSFSVTDKQQEVLDRFLSFWMWPMRNGGGAEAFAKLFPLAPWANPFTSQLTSPYDVNPLNINPLRDVWNGWWILSALPNAMISNSSSPPRGCIPARFGCFGAKM
jgi:NTE family protein